MRSNKPTNRPPVVKVSMPSSINEHLNTLDAEHLNTLDAYTQGADINRMPVTEQEYGISGQISVKSMSTIGRNKLDINTDRSVIASQILLSQRDS
jgi:hypothetical protein